MLVLFIGCAVSVVYNEVEPIPEENPEEPGVGVLTRRPVSQLVNAACFLVPDVDAIGNTVTHGFILVPATGPYVQQRGCTRALYYLAPGVLVVGGTSKAREGEKLPSLCLEVEPIEMSP